MNLVLPPQNRTDVAASPMQRFAQSLSHDRLLAAAARRVGADPNHRLWRVDDPTDTTPLGLHRPTDLLFMGGKRLAHDLPSASDCFNSLRWGGQLVAISSKPAQAEALAKQLAGSDLFAIESRCESVRHAVLGLHVPGLSKQGYLTVARKTKLTPPQQDTQRYTYDVSLAQADAFGSLSRDSSETLPSDDAWVVRKTVPSEDAIFSRLQQRLPNTPEDTLLRRSHFLANQALPMFLSREALTLKHLAQTLPDGLKNRVPELVDLVVDDQQRVRQLDIRWLKPATEAITHLRFAHELAQVVDALHEHAGVLHLDLRLDNMVIAQHGLCLVDFGNALRMDENLDKKPMVKNLIHEVIQNSATRRDLKQLLEERTMNKLAFEQVSQAPGPHTDVFYVALQTSRNKFHGELGRLIQCCQPLDALKPLHALAKAFLKPKNAKHIQWKTAADFLRGVNRLQDRYGEHNHDLLKLVA